MFLGTCFNRERVQKAAGSPLLPAKVITSENCGFWQGLSGFFGRCEEYCFVGVSYLNYSQKK
jgi:hypothetical protein